MIVYVYYICLQKNKIIFYKIYCNSVYTLFLSNFKVFINNVWICFSLYNLGICKHSVGFYKCLSTLKALILL